MSYSFYILQFVQAALAQPVCFPHIFRPSLRADRLVPDLYTVQLYNS